MSTLATASPSPHRTVYVAVSAWALAAVAFGLSGAIAHLPRPAIPLLIWSPVIACVALYRRGGALRDLVRDGDHRPLVLYHLVRVYFGAMFLVEMSAGRIPAAFARVAGPGDIAAGLLALPATWCATRTDRASRALLLGWNALGLVDILLVFLTAQRLVFIEGDPLLFAAFSRFPYATLPVFVVPMVILTHLAVFARARRA